jgi:hypothetical protein
MSRLLDRVRFPALVALFAGLVSVAHANDRVRIGWTPFPVPCPDVGVNAIARWTLSARVDTQTDGSVLLRSLELAFSSVASVLGAVDISGSLTVGDQRVGLVRAWFPVISDGRDLAIYTRSEDGLGARDGVLPIRWGARGGLSVRAGAVLRRAGGTFPIGNLDRTLTLQDFREAQR